MYDTLVQKPQIEKTIKEVMSGDSPFFVIDCYFDSRIIFIVLTEDRKVSTIYL